MTFLFILLTWPWTLFGFSVEIPTNVILSPINYFLSLSGSRRFLRAQYFALRYVKLKCICIFVKVYADILKEKFSIYVVYVDYYIENIEN